MPVDPASAAAATTSINNLISEGGAGVAMLFAVVGAFILMWRYVLFPFFSKMEQTSVSLASAAGLVRDAASAAERSSLAAERSSAAAERAAVDARSAAAEARQAAEASQKIAESLTARAASIRAGEA